MALDDFWTNVRRASKLPYTERIVDAPRLHADDVERALRETKDWLTPRSVAGFDEADFPFLPENERTNLARLVKAFQEIAPKPRPPAPVPDAVVEQARPLFRDLVSALEFDRYADSEAFRLGKLIEQEIEPWRTPDLEELRFQTGLDHSGDPAVWVWALLSAEVSETDDRFLDCAQGIRPLLQQAARDVDREHFAYLRFRAVNEPAESVETA